MSVDPQSPSSTEKVTATEPEASGPLQLQIVNWPLRNDRNRSVVLVLGLLATSIFAGVMAGSYTMGLLIGFALVIASWRYWLPVTYEIGPYGIRQTVCKRVRRISWRQVGRVEFRPHGIRFFPDHDPSQLANLRGLYVCYPGQEETLKQVVTYYTNSLQPAGTTSRPTAN